MILLSVSFFFIAIFPLHSFVVGFFISCIKSFFLKTIIVSVSNDLTTDQRVTKICNTLCANNFKVILIGRKLKNSLPVFREYKTERIRLLFNKGFLFYAEFNFRLFLKLLFTKKDLILSNDLDTLLPNYLISIIQSKKIIYDSHELFPEIPELIDRPTVKGVWLNIERTIIPNLKNCFTVCDSIANYYSKIYKIEFKTIKNLPVKKEVLLGKFSFSTKDKKVILYQGALNIGRGLELLIETVALLEKHILVIIGDGDISNNLKLLASNSKANNRIFFLGRIAPYELQKLTPLADIGISLEEDLGLNYRYALPNKLFDYIQAEIPVLVSDLPEMKKIVTQFNIGEIVIDRSPKALAKKIEGFQLKKNSKELIKAKEVLNWNSQEDKLLSIFNNAV